MRPQTIRPGILSMFNHRYAALSTSSSWYSSGISRSRPGKTQPSSARGWLPSGWRGMAVINIAVLTVIILLLTGLLIAATSATGNLVQSWQIHTADCQTITAINTTLHLLINILSTIVLASSNFFMQVLNAPTRAEVDHAHERGRWLDIGIPSWRNAYWLSPFKLLACLCLLLTSMPIHLVFNSAVFKMDHRMGDFHATIASGSFVEGGSYFLPGASLVTNELFIETNRKYGHGFGNESLLPTFDDLLNRNYSAYALNISNAAVNAPSWERLGAPACWRVFEERSCTGLKDHRNVPLVPPDELNSLWYSAQCDMTGIINASGSPDCFHTCNNLFSMRERKYSTSTTKPWDIADHWNASLYAAPGDGSKLGFLLDSFGLDIDYCLVEPRELPYKFGIPSMAFSILTHWLLSNALFVIISRGSYYKIGHGEEDYTNDPTSLPEDAVITLSASPAASLAFLVVGVVSLLLPVAMSAQKLPGQMPVVGSNSLAIAAACRVSPLAKTYGDFDREHEMQTAEAGEPNLVPDEDAGMERPDITQDIALYRLKWGEVRMPDYWYFGMRCGITLAQFKQYNTRPGKPDPCALQPGEHVCCNSWTLSDFSPKPDGDGYCHKYLVKTGDNCAALSAEYDLTNEKTEEYNKETWGYSLSTK
ncbi:hypothetical protein CPLU01_15603 [Colletotrichum plurivorum]|uniref:DUF6536 domain-containing protein n=1 Tax=Colletotrichum plurivorum TaxID=2175906 RepID=A0A8H6JA11_9PEZI|nr:hypothetical protein CPLU01_15603 [Colletotrichum plurivorum]